MQIWECIKSINYGRIDFSPDAKDKSQRVIELPDNIDPDDTIKEHFSLADKPKEKTIIADEKPINDKVNELIGMHDNVPDILKKVERVSLEEKQKQIKASFKKKKGGK